MNNITVTIRDEVVLMQSEQITQTEMEAFVRVFHVSFDELCFEEYMDILNNYEGESYIIVESFEQYKGNNVNNITVTINGEEKLVQTEEFTQKEFESFVTVYHMTKGTHDSFTDFMTPLGYHDGAEYSFRQSFKSPREVLEPLTGGQFVTFIANDHEWYDNEPQKAIVVKDQNQIVILKDGQIFHLEDLETHKMTLETID